jgi:PTS system mannose-specific IIA component
MIGVVLFAHGRLGNELAKAAEMILGPQDGLVPVGVETHEGEAVIKSRLDKAVDEADGGAGVLLLTDMFGGTPMNFGCGYLDSSEVEVVTGVNLAMVIKALTARKQESVPLRDLARDVAQHGRADISVASELLRSRAKGEDESP